ncbi:MAG: sulfotransferase [Anaerolineales bacterium]
MQTLSPLPHFPIIITGCRRSGTTLLRTMLEQHSKLYVHPQEPQFIQQLARRFGPQIHAPHTAVDLILSHPYCPPVVTAPSFQTVLQGRPSLSLPELIQAYLTVWAGEHLQTRHPVLKDPAWIFHLDWVQAWFPQGKIIHIVRDPRANVSSQRARWPKASVYECAIWWRDAVRAGHTLALQKPQVCFELIYEALVTEPEETLSRLCDFLAIPFEPQMLTFDLDTPTYAPGEAPKRTRFTRPDPARLQLWQDHLSPADIRLIEKICAPEMTWWHYLPSTPPVSPLALTGKYLLQRSSFTLLKTARTLRDRLQRS